MRLAHSPPIKRLRAASALVLAGACALTQAQPAAEAAAAQQRRESGRALFHGERAFARAATVAGAALPTDVLACARCHGSGATGSQGGREAGVVVPWLASGQPTNEAQARQVVQALARGQSMSGRDLAPPMPRYQLTADEQASLAAFLAVLGTEAEPVRGVDEDTVHLGVLLPAAGTRAAAARAALQGLREQMDAVNRAGGLYGRQMALHAIELPMQPGARHEDWISVIEPLLIRQPVLALVGSWLGELPAPLWPWLRARRLPVIASVGPALAEPPAQPGWSSTLLPSVQTQLAGSLPEFDQRCGPQDAPLLVTHAALPGLREAVQAALPGRALAFKTLDELERGAVSPDSAHRILALQPGADLAMLRSRLAPRDCLWTLAMFSGSGSAQAPNEMLTLPAYAALPLAGADPQALWISLGRLAGQLSTELLSQAGRRLQPEALVRAQTTLVNFEPTAGVALQLSRQRRHALPVMASWRNAP